MTADRRRNRHRVAVAVCVTGLLLASCSSDDNDNAGSESTASSTAATTLAPTTTTRARPAGPAADLSTELRDGERAYLGEAALGDLEPLGYAQREYVASGSATSYEATGPLTGDGRWDFAPDASAPYATRVVVRAPTDADAFSGTVVVEWLNVSGGVDANPDWASLAEEIIRAGHAWVGVSAQRIGVEGGPVLVAIEGLPGAQDQGKGLKAIDPARYGDLVHPGDGYAFDMFTQVARAVRSGAGLDGLAPQRLIAAGESQSAGALVTYINGVHPLVETFDAYFVHSRFAAGLPLVADGGYADLAGSIGAAPTIVRTDLDVPVLDLQTEGDVTGILNSYSVRQPDTDRFRLWEVAGTAHADAHLVGETAEFIDCGVAINDGTAHIVAKAALRALTTWLDTGTPPPSAPRLEIAPGETPTVGRDADGIALGGIRTPPVDVPIATLSGVAGPAPSTICLLLGSTIPFSAERLADLYASRDEYDERYEAAVDATIAAGFALLEDRDALLGFADPSRIS